jgi:hypothetical protein
VSGERHVLPQLRLPSFRLHDGRKDNRGRASAACDTKNHIGTKRRKAALIQASIPVIIVPNLSITGTAERRLAGQIMRIIFYFIYENCLFPFNPF